MLRPWLAAVTLFVTAAETQAQSRWQTLENNVKSSVGDAWDVWTSPLRGRQKDWLGAAGAVGVSAAVSPLDDNVDRWAVTHRDDAAFNFLAPVRPGGWAFSGKTVTPLPSARLRSLSRPTTSGSREDCSAAPLRTARAASSGPSRSIHSSRATVPIRIAATGLQPRRATNTISTFRVRATGASIHCPADISRTLPRASPFSRRATTSASSSSPCCG